jgi:Flp pilus assembly protein TadG
MEVTMISTRGRHRTQSLKRPHADRPGQSLVELAITAPLLLLILLGTIDLGRMYGDYVGLRNGAREGVGYGILKPDDVAGMKSAVLAANVPVGTTPTASCTGSCSTINGTGMIVVSANSTFRPVTFGFFTWMGVPSSFSLSATAKMRVLS